MPAVDLALAVPVAIDVLLNVAELALIDLVPLASDASAVWNALSAEPSVVRAAELALALAAWASRMVVVGAT